MLQQNEIQEPPKENGSFANFISRDIDFMDVFSGRKSRLSMILTITLRPRVKENVLNKFLQVLYILQK